MFIDLNFRECKLTFRKIEPGYFNMGSVKGLPIEIPVKRISISKPFFVLITPVTQELWVSIMNYNPSTFRGSESLPVEGVSWDQANEFCMKFSQLIGKEIRLLTEAEWEYVCRAGTRTEYFFGEEWHLLRDYAWFDYNSMDRTHPVATRLPNSWGLYDIVGNVWEWCSDIWCGDYGNAPCESLAKEGLADKSRRVLRGGAWDMDYYRCRSAYRSCEGREIATSKIGLRIALDCVY